MMRTVIFALGLLAFVVVAAAGIVLAVGDSPVFVPHLRRWWNAGSVTGVPAYLMAGSWCFLLAGVALATARLWFATSSGMLAARNAAFAVAAALFVMALLGSAMQRGGVSAF